MLINSELFKSTFISLLLFLVVNNNVAASSTCYAENKYPNITSIRQGSNGLEFTAAWRNFDNKNRMAPIITLTNDSAWDKREWKVTGNEKCKTYDCIKANKCNVNIPEIKLGIKQALNLRSFRYIPESIEQTISTCVKDADNVYFGIAFYAGEGVSGVGGIGRYNLVSKKTEIRRLPILRDSSVTNIAYDGKQLWIATAHHHECSGTPPAVGLIRYDWNQNIIQDFNDINSGFCGFVIHDILITDESAWVATDMGLSQTYRTGKRYNSGWESGWRHYIPQPGSKEVMQKVWCGNLYKDLLNTLPKYDDPTGTSSYNQLFENLARFKTDDLKRYIKSLKKQK